MGNGAIAESRLEFAESTGSFWGLFAGLGAVPGERLAYTSRLPKRSSCAVGCHHWPLSEALAEGPEAPRVPGLPALALSYIATYV
jgi:hypothetical protein